MLRAHLQRQPNLDDVLLELRRVMTESLRMEAKRFGLSMAHFEVLKFVFERGDPTMHIVAEYLRIKAPSASALVDGLVRKGYIVRSQSKKDRRMIRIALTAKSHRLFASLNKRKASIFNRILNTLEPADRKQLAVLIAKCVISLKNKQK